MPTPPKSHTTRITIHDRVVNAVSPNLFGHFMELEVKSETGPSTAWLAEEGRFREDVARALRLMNIPHMRYPGGSCVEFGPKWSAYIDAPGETRAPLFRFGFHEFFQVCRDLDAEPLLVAPVARSLHPELDTTYEQSLEEAAAMAAYFNAPLDNDLPENLQSWPKLRAANGHPEPFGVRHWQMGNELFLAFLNPAREAGWPPEKIASEYARFVRDHAEALKGVDPGIRIIVEVQPQMFEGVDIKAVFAEKLADVADMASVHIYQTWQINQVERDGEPVAIEDLEIRDYAQTLASTPCADEEGLSVLQPDQRALLEFGKPLAVTEWNLNTFWKKELMDYGYPSCYLANGLGAAGFLHAFMRAGDDVVWANQSMLIGDCWDLGCIRIAKDDPSRFRFDARGQVLSLYSRFHGPERLATSVENQRHYRQPYEMGAIHVREKMAYLDPVATRRGSEIFLHLINRDFDRVARVEVDISALGGVPRSLIRHTMTGPADPGGEFGASEYQTTLTSDPAPVDCREGVLTLSAPAASVNVYAISMR